MKLENHPVQEQVLLVESYVWALVVLIVTVILAGIVFFMLYSVTFVTQPIKSMAPIDQGYLKMLNDIVLLIVGGIGGVMSRKGVQTSAGSDTFSVTTSKTGWGQFLYGVDTLFNPDKAHQYGEAAGTINTFGTSATVLRIKPKGLLNQLSWEVVADTAGSDYTLSAVNTKGFALDDLVIKAQT